MAILRRLAEEFLWLTAPVEPAPTVTEITAESPILEPAVPVAPQQHVPLPSAPGIEIPVGGSGDSLPSRATCN